jgi:RNA polymerase sigma factor (sigma-70 family)
MSECSSIGHYLNLIGRIQLLQADQEITLGKRVQAWIAIRDNKDLTLKERRVCRVGKRARDAMVNANLRLVVDIAKKYVRRSESSTLLDLVNMGNEGLIKGVERFDPTRGYRLTTFCYWWIRQGIVRGMHETDNMIRLPSHVHEQLGNVAKAIGEANEPITLGQAAKIANAKVHFIECAYIAKHVSSLDKVLECDKTIIECIPDKTQVTFDYQVESGVDVHRLIGVLDERERFVLLRRYGMANDHAHWTLQALGNELGISRERARQYEQRAIRKLRFAASNTLEAA